MSDTPKKTLTITRKPNQKTLEAIQSPESSTVTMPELRAMSRTGKRIIRREELPNVQRPGQGKPKPTGKADTGKKKPARKPAPRKPVISPSELKARELNDRLNGFPVWRDFLPLAIGIDKDVFRLVNEEHFPGASKRVVRLTLAMHANHGRYLQAVVQGGARYHLDGSEEGDITAYQQQHAAEILAKRQQTK
ncbi:MAG: ProQ/FinO family protein [Gammaproteobacteria bacterium]|nr:ProQ/FinO family protein [Gammaproteobacteria bacterium]MBU1722951.1 ProQ/FinO family protein [Gammaproteobacteria bacterium]MBU2005672.1 ProQ/FinO family protein [Gammaproteobacteria bacterium]